MIDIRWIIVFAINAVFIFCTQLMNDTLGIYGFHIILGGLPILYAGLYMPAWRGFLILFILGLVADAGSAAYFGATSCLYITLFSILITLRPHLKINGQSILFLGQCTNLALTIALHLTSPLYLTHLLSVVLSAFTSQLLIATLTIPYLNALTQALNKLGLQYSLKTES